MLKEAIIMEEQPKVRILHEVGIILKAEENDVTVIGCWAER